MEDLQLWISHGVRTPRILRSVAGRCFTFQMTPQVQDQLRSLGASPELITGLVQRCPPVTQVAVNQPPSPPRQSKTQSRQPPGARPSGSTGVRRESRFSRRVLRPLYYDHPAILTAYGAVMTPEWTGTNPGTHQVDLPDGDQITVRMPDAPVSLVTYGAKIGGPSGWGLDAEMYAHQEDFKMLLVGPSVEPFLPVGRTRFRLILGATGWFAVAGQDMPILSEFGGDPSDTLTVTSVGVGGDGRAGLAYHLMPGLWIFAEARYRWIDSLYRYAGTSSTETIDDFPWPNLGFRGSSIVFGIGL